MARKPLEIGKLFIQEQEAAYIANTWVNYSAQRFPKTEEWKEVRNYLFATDTSTTSNQTLPWKNRTTLPKLCQIADNLHSNYLSALFPNDEWLKWEGYSLEDSVKAKATAIQSYMANKTRVSQFRTEVSKLVKDYIQYGNCFAMPYFEASYIDGPNGEKIIDYIGPRVRRISPMDIVFNPLASTFKESYKIIRSIRTVGELKNMAAQEPDNQYLQKALKNREVFDKHASAFGIEDFDKSEGYQVDGFGNYFEYLQSGYVEFLEFYGDIHNQETGKLETGMIITVVDRCTVIDRKPNPSWLGHAPIYHAGWRTRPDNLWAMGPLDNLVGMQYRVDHLENAKADAIDLAIAPPLVISGDVEQFEYKPFGEIHIDEGGGVTELARNTQWVLQADNEIQMLLTLMEQFAGAPSEAMGIRTPGEKTMYEVQQLQNAAGRIFQEKVTNFEIELLEPLLNAMLEVSRRNMDASDVLRVMDNDLGVITFMEVTKDDITASGKLRPIGARHFASQAQLLQNLTGLVNSPLGRILMPHLSSLKLAPLVEDILGVGRYELFRPNVAVIEQQETARLTNQAGENLEVEASTDPSSGVVA